MQNARFITLLSIELLLIDRNYYKYSLEHNSMPFQGIVLKLHGKIDGNDKWDLTSHKATTAVGMSICHGS